MSWCLWLFSGIVLYMAKFLSGYCTSFVDFAKKWLNEWKKKKKTWQNLFLIVTFQEHLNFTGSFAKVFIEWIDKYSKKKSKEELYKKKKNNKKRNELAWVAPTPSPHTHFWKTTIRPGRYLIGYFIFRYNKQKWHENNVSRSFQQKIGRLKSDRTKPETTTLVI